MTGLEKLPDGNIEERRLSFNAAADTVSSKKTKEDIVEG